MQTKSSRLSVVKYPNDVLRKKCAQVERVTPEIAYFTEEMGEIMYTADGVGLAAPQVGISLRILVADSGDGLQALINPQIISREGEQIGPEGCLSLPGLFGDVPRANKIVVRAVNQHGKKVTLTGEGFWARVMQHEIDHLDGVMFIDHVLKDTLHWITGETDSHGDVIERPTSLEEALKVFEQRAVQSPV